MSDPSNPFADQDEQKAPPPNPFESGDYEDDKGNSNDEFISKEKQQEIAVSAMSNPVVQSAVKNVASEVIAQQGDKFKQDYEEKSQLQSNVNQAPETPACCIKAFEYFPMRFFAMFGGILLIAFPILDIFIYPDRLSFVSFFISSYIFLFGIIVFFIETPLKACAKPVRLTVFFWFRLLSRTWGRAWFYIFVAFLTFGEISEDFTYTFIAGIYILLIGVICFVFSKLSAAKYQRMFVFMTEGKEGDELIQKLMSKFDALDEDQDGRIGETELRMLAVEAGRELASSETYAICSFLDDSCNGYICKEDWMKQWSTYNLKQKFL